MTPSHLALALHPSRKDWPTSRRPCPLWRPLQPFFQILLESQILLRWLSCPILPDLRPSTRLLFAQYPPPDIHPPHHPRGRVGGNEPVPKRKAQHATCQHEGGHLLRNLTTQWHQATWLWHSIQVGKIGQQVGDHALFDVLFSPSSKFSWRAKFFYAGFLAWSCHRRQGILTTRLHGGAKEWQAGSPHRGMGGWALAPENHFMRTNGICKWNLLY